MTKFELDKYYYCGDLERFGFEAEIDSFISMSPNEFIKGKWKEMKEKLKALPINRDTYGFIHNDNHQMNIIASGNKISVIDFDCAECHFFVNDILLPVQGLLFDVTGGMMKPISKPEVLKDFIVILWKVIEQKMSWMSIGLGN